MRKAHEGKVSSSVVLRVTVSLKSRAPNNTNKELISTTVIVQGWHFCLSCGSELDSRIRYLMNNTICLSVEFCCVVMKRTKAWKPISKNKQ